MATVSPIIPSGSTDGAPVKITATATAGTLFHTADASGKDEVWMWAVNRDTVNRLLTVELGGATAPDFNVTIDLPPNEPILVLAGVRLTNSKTVKAFVAAANVVSVFGNINRYTV